MYSGTDIVRKGWVRVARAYIVTKQMFTGALSAHICVQLKANPWIPPGCAKL